MITTEYKFCPSCQQENRVDEVACIHCGKIFKSASEKYPTTKDVDSETRSPLQNIKDEIPSLDLEEPGEGIAIYLYAPLNYMAIRLENEFVIGRLMEAAETNIFDLTSFNAFNLGVSRRHVMVRRAGDGYEVMDLDSTNGTWVNEQRLEPHLPYAVKSGSQIRLGNMRIGVAFRRQIPGN